MRTINLIILAFAAGLTAQSLSGGGGLLRTPTALLNDDATAVIGSSFLPAETLPYTHFQRDVQAVSGSVTFLPFLEISLRLSHQLGLDDGVNHTADRMASCKFRIVPESRFVPAVVLGINDLSSTVKDNRARHFAASYAVISKTLVANGLCFQPTVGYAHKFFQANHYDFTGWFGGIELYHEQFSVMHFLLEFEQERVNAGARFLFLKHVYLSAAWMDLQHFSCNISYAFYLNKLTQLY